MRIGISMPFKDGDGRPLDAAGIAARAAMVEQAGLDGVWIQDSLIPASAPPADAGAGTGTQGRPPRGARGGRADAFDRLITSVARDGDGKVTAVGGDFGVRSRASVIIDIQNGAHTYHLEAGGRRVDVLVTQQDGRRQLSAPDGADGADALAGLPATEGAAL